MIVIKNLSKSYGNHIALRNINLEIADGEVVALIGPSGSGKSTILRCINGLDSYEEGEIMLGSLPPTKVGMVFQQFNLFPNMTIMENLIYAPVKVLKKPIAECKEKAKEFLAKVKLENFADKYPASLSGGQKQRAAIARALCMDPEIVLFDEPTSALDPENVKEVLNTIKDFVHTGITMLIVTHEMQFASEVADRIIFLDHGVIVEDATAKEFFQNSKNQRVQEFLSNVL